MDRMISYFIVLLLAVALGIGWDRRPEVSWHTKFLFWNPGFDIPAGPLPRAISRASTAEAHLKTCAGNADRLLAVQRAQEASVQAERKQSADWVAASDREHRRVAALAASWNARAQSVLASTTPETSEAGLCHAADQILKGAGE